MHEQPFTRQDAVNAKNKNIIELALGFSAMTRVFAKQSDTKILEWLETFFKGVGGVTTQSEYDALHSGFCDWFVKNISTAAKTFGKGRIIASRKCSYGHAAKVLDVAAKVYIYFYCARPSFLVKGSLPRCVWRTVGNLTAHPPLPPPCFINGPNHL